MAYKRLRVGTSAEGFEFGPDGYYHEYIADTVEDLAAIPLNGKGREKPRPGSTCLVTGTKDVYVLDAQGAWTILIEAETQQEEEGEG